MKEVFELAQEKGYKLQLPDLFKIIPDQPFYLELCLIQKWLRDTHHLHVDLEFRASAGIYFYQVVKTHSSTIHSPHFKGGTVEVRFYDYKIPLSYEEALLQGVKEALQLIKQ